MRHGSTFFVITCVKLPYGVQYATSLVLSYVAGISISNPKGDKYYFKCHLPCSSVKSYLHSISKSRVSKVSNIIRYQFQPQDLSVNKIAFFLLQFSYIFQGTSICLLTQLNCHWHQVFIIDSNYSLTFLFILKR
jgi:hypothetical protein